MQLRRKPMLRYKLGRPWREKSQRLTLKSRRRRSTSTAHRNGRSIEARGTSRLSCLIRSFPEAKPTQVQKSRGHAPAATSSTWLACLLNRRKRNRTSFGTRLRVKTFRTRNCRRRSNQTFEKYHRSRRRIKKARSNSTKRSKSSKIRHYKG